MSGRLLLTLLALVATALPTDAAGIFTRKGKSDFRVRQLVETLKNDADDAKRRAAIAELKEADPRTQLDVVPALVAVLQRDRVAEVRADAAEAIGQFKVVNPVAGLALEMAAESDPSSAVRGAAQQALWEYHLGGYRSARWADGITGQTAEPPLARPVVRPAAAVEFGPPMPEPNPPAIPKMDPPSVGLPTMELPPPTTVVALRPAPTAVTTEEASDVRVLLTAAPPPQLNVTDEPPRALPPVLAPAPMPRLVEFAVAENPLVLPIPTPVGVPTLTLPRGH